jgi:hypothetical protein
MIAFASAPLNSVISPTFLPGAGSHRAAKGLFHLNASVATPPTSSAMASSVVLPASREVHATSLEPYLFQPSARLQSAVSM